MKLLLVCGETGWLPLFFGNAFRWVVTLSTSFLMLRDYQLFKKCQSRGEDEISMTPDLLLKVDFSDRTLSGNNHLRRP